MGSEAVRIFLERCQGKWEEASGDMQLPCPEIEELFQKFQNPAEADKLTKVETDLEEVKGLVMQSLDDLLKRGESLDQLMAKSKDLSNTSVQFYRTAKKNNQCCKMSLAKWAVLPKAAAAAERCHEMARLALCTS